MLVIEFMAKILPNGFVSNPSTFASALDVDAKGGSCAVTHQGAVRFATPLKIVWRAGGSGALVTRRPSRKTEVPRLDRAEGALFPGSY
jgi:hypothetical protein